ncbi:MAG: phytase [Prolixibacteraceae bacterium]|nr:phytase [Prolixibacteraceae bacterium]
MKKPSQIITVFGLLAIIIACNSENKKVIETSANPLIITDKTPNDTDDPAIWYNSSNPEKSLILGTDKGDSTGGIFVFNLEGKLDTTLSITNLKRPNNIDIEYGFQFQGKTIDIAAFTERGRDMLRVISLPDCKFIDGGGIPVFEDDSLRSPMGISLYKDKSKSIFAFVGRKSGPADGYIYQYRLVDTGASVSGIKVRTFGKYSGKKEIEAIVVDDEQGYIYYSDETIGIRQYYADADKGNKELSLFATTGITSDHEGLSIYRESDKNGYIILSDQQANKFQLFTRQGTKSNPFDHRLVRIVQSKTIESDGSDILNMPLNSTFPQGIFVAMSTDKTFQFYKTEDIVGKKSFWQKIISE